MATRERSKGSGEGAALAPSPLSGLIERQNLRRMAGGRSFERAEGYFADGRVHGLAEAYRAQIEPTLAQKNNDAYRQAIVLLRKVRGLLVRLAREQEFGDCVTALRLAHKPKRNFIKLLDHAKW